MSTYVHVPREESISVCIYCVRYTAAKMHGMPEVAGLFLQKSHKVQGCFVENDM